MDDARLLTRRRLLGAAGATTAATVLADPMLSAAVGATRRKPPVARGGAFDCGVLSGDPKSTSITLWTHVAELEQNAARVRVEVARDPGFRRVVASKLVPTARDRDHTVKVRVGGLKPDERYWYRFATRGAHSPVGRAQTAPGADSKRPLRIGFFSCQDYESGYYGAYRRFVEEDCDVVLCLGDYIYERAYWKDPAREDRTGSNRDGVARTLADYRAKYRLYRSDPDLRELHRQIPLIAIWDDHEVEDNYVADPSSEDYDRPRQLAGWRAFHDYQPNLRFKEATRIYRRLSFGALAELFLLDDRQYRADQPCGDRYFTGCPDAAKPRAFLGARQLGWLKDRLGRSKADWKLVGNQVMMMPLDLVEGIAITQDSWEGYLAERSDLLGSIRDRGIRDVAFLTGDIHTFFAGEVREPGARGVPLATEFVGGSTTSHGISETIADVVGVNNDAISLVTDALGITNPWLRYADTRSHGVAIADVEPSELRVSYWGSRHVRTRDASADTRELARFRVRRGSTSIERLR